MITRRETLAGAGASALVLGMSQYAAAQAGVTIRQGYQTNMWGMPTYYLMRSGELEKRGLKFEEFGVPSGNLTMQQMVARQVDLGLPHLDPRLERVDACCSGGLDDLCISPLRFRDKLL